MFTSTMFAEINWSGKFSKFTKVTPFYINYLPKTDEKYAFLGGVFGGFFDTNISISVYLVSYTSLIPVFCLVSKLLQVFFYGVWLQNWISKKEQLDFQQYLENGSRTKKGLED